MANLPSVLKKWIETSSPKRKWTAVLAVVSLFCTTMLLFLNDSSDAATDPLGSTPLYFAGALIKLLVVLLLIFASAILARRWLQPGSKGRIERKMRLMETVRLSPKQALHLVTIGDQQFVVGATDQHVSLIAQLEGSFEVVPEGTAVAPSLDFGSLLHSLNAKVTGSSSG